MLIQRYSTSPSTNISALSFQISNIRVCFLIYLLKYQLIFFHHSLLPPPSSHLPLVLPMNINNSITAMQTLGILLFSFSVLSVLLSLFFLVLFLFNFSVHFQCVNFLRIRFWSMKILLSSRWTRCVWRFFFKVPKLEYYMRVKLFWRPKFF